MLRKVTFVPLKACDHGGKKGFGNELIEIKGVSRFGSEKRQKCELRPAITITKRVDGIEFSKEICCFGSKILTT